MDVQRMQFVPTCWENVNIHAETALQDCHALVSNISIREIIIGKTWENCLLS